MAQKQGSKSKKGKSSSPSDQSYWKRVSPSTQKAKRIARHCARMGKSEKQLAVGLTIPDFPKLSKAREFISPIPMAALRDLPNIAQQGGGYVIADGRIIEAAVSSNALHDAFTASRVIPRVIVRHFPLGLVTTEQRLR